MRSRKKKLKNRKNDRTVRLNSCISNISSGTAWHIQGLASNNPATYIYLSIVFRSNLQTLTVFSVSFTLKQWMSMTVSGKHSIILSRQNRLVSIVFLAASLDIWMIFLQLLGMLIWNSMANLWHSESWCSWIVPKPSSSWKIHAKWKPILYF